MPKYLTLDNLDDRGQKRYKELHNQIKNIYRKTNDNNIGTARKYYAAMDSLAKYIAQYESIQKITKVESKHIYEYVEYLKTEGMSDSTLKSYMSGVRDFYYATKRLGVKCKTVIPDNNKLGIEKRVIGKVDRHWDAKEISAAKELALSMEREDVYYAINVAEQFGMRINEICNMSMPQIRTALMNGELCPTGTKGNRPRSIPVNTIEQSKTLVDLKGWGETRFIKDDKVFVSVGSGVRDAINKIQDWIGNMREKFQLEDRISMPIARTYYKELGIVVKSNLTMHGLRHTYLQKQYDYFRGKGMEDKEARLRVSDLAGHNRGEVTEIYLARSN